MVTPPSGKTLWNFIKDSAAIRLKNPLIRRRYFVAYCLGCCLGFSGLWFSETRPGFPFGGPCDFTTFYTGALIIRSGNAQNLYNIPTQMSTQQSLLLPHGWQFQDGLLPYLYPPIFAALFVPITYIPLGFAFHVWNLISLLMLLASIKMLSNYQHRGSLRNFVFSSLAVLAFFPTFEVFLNGQASFLILFILAVVYIQLSRGNEMWAGFAMGFALLKPQLVLVLALVALIQRRWRMLVSFVAVAILLTSASCAIVGVEGAIEYISLGKYIMGLNDSYGYSPAIMPNVLGSAFRFGLVYEILVGMKPLSWLLSAIIGTLTTIVLFVFLFYCRGKELLKNAAFDIQYALILLTTLLITPYLFRHDLSLLVLSGFIIYAALLKIKNHILANKIIAVGHLAMLLLSFMPPEICAQIIVLMLFGLLLFLGYLIKHFSPLIDI